MQNDSFDSNDPGFGTTNTTNSLKYILQEYDFTWNRCFKYSDTHDCGLHTLFYYLHYFQYIPIVIGCFNLPCSLVVFSQSRYKDKTIPFLLRCYYISASIAVLDMSIDNMVHDFSMMPKHFGVDPYFIFIEVTTSQFCDGILVPLAIVRLVYAFYPFNLNSTQAFRFCYISLALILLTTVAVNTKLLLSGNLKGDKLFQVEAIFNLIVIFLTLAINCVWVIKERSFSSQHTNINSVGRRMIDTTSKFMLISSAIFWLSSLPFAVMNLIPPVDVQEIGCNFCRKYVVIYTLTYRIRKLNLVIDNSLYMAFSYPYRRDLTQHWLFRGVCAKLLCLDGSLLDQYYRSRSTNLSTDTADHKTSTAAAAV